MKGSTRTVIIFKIKKLKNREDNSKFFFLPGKRLFLQIENPNLYLKKHIKIKIK